MHEYCIRHLHFDIHSLTDDSYRAEEGASQLRPANSNQGFLSVSLRVPSYDPMPADDSPTAPQGGKASTEQRHGYDLIGIDETAVEGRVQVVRDNGSGVALNPDNRMNLKDVIDTNTRETLTRSDGAALKNSRDHGYVNTSLPSEQAVPSKDSSIRKKPVIKPDNRKVDEEGYDTIERERGSEDPPKYDIVLLDQDTPASKPVEHKYHVLEGDKEKLKKYSKTLPHTLVVPQEKQDYASSDGRGVVVALNAAAQPVIQRGLQSSMSLRQRPSRDDSSVASVSTKQTRTVDPGYNEPWVSHRHIPRRTTYSSSNSDPTAAKNPPPTASKGPAASKTPATSKIPATSKAPAASKTPAASKAPRNEDLFDDPAYATTSSMSGSINMNKATGKQAPAGDVAGNSTKPHPRTDSPKVKQKLQRFDYETTGDIGELSELEQLSDDKDATVQSLPTPPLRNGGGGESTTLLTATTEAGFSSSHNPYELSSKPNASSRSIYEPNPLNLKVQNLRGDYELASLAPGPNSHDPYEQTSLRKPASTKLMSSSDMFDDPAYDFGLNMQAK